MRHPGKMKWLFAEPVPRQLAQFFPETFEVRTAQQMGWAESNNGDVLKRATTHGFAALIIADQGIEYQQNPDTLPTAVLVLIASRTRVQELRPLVPRILGIVTVNVQRRIYRITESDSSE